MATDRDKRDEELKAQSSYRSLASQAIGMGFSVVIWVGLGVFADSIFKTAPIFILVGVFFSLATIGYLMWQLVKAPK